MKDTIEIQNLKCGGCEATILYHLQAIQGVHNIFLDIEKNTVSLDYENNNVLQKVYKTLARLGYPIISDNNSLVRKVKSYVSCTLGKIKK